MANLIQDLRFAVRLLVRNPAVTIVAILSLALGVGANTTVFTLVNAILLNPMPVKDIDRLVTVGTTEVRNGAPVQLNGTSRPNFEDLRDQNTVFSGVTLTGFTPLAWSGDAGEPEQLFAQIVSGNFFDVLGAPIAAGRTFLPIEDQQFGAHPVTVLSYGLWQRRFGGSRDLDRPVDQAQRARLHRHRRHRRGIPRRHSRRRSRSVGAVCDAPAGADGAWRRHVQVPPRAHVSGVRPAQGRRVDRAGTRQRRCHRQSAGREFPDRQSRSILQPAADVRGRRSRRRSSSSSSCRERLAWSSSASCC